jgi:hypothetical protein
MIEAADLPAVLTWSQALNWMMFSKLDGVDPGDTLALEMAYYHHTTEPPPNVRLTLEQARSALLERLISGKAVATGRDRCAVDPNAMSEDSLPSEISTSAWPDLRLDGASSFAPLADASVGDRATRTCA